jgi:hypothetical protein
MKTKMSSNSLLPSGEVHSPRITGLLMLSADYSLIWPFQSMKPPLLENMTAMSYHSYGLLPVPSQPVCTVVAACLLSTGPI